MQQHDAMIAGYLSGLQPYEDVIRFADNTLIVICQIGGLDEDMTDAFCSDAFQYGLFQQKHIPFLLFDVVDLQLDFVINAYDLFISEKRQKLDHYQGAAKLIIILPGTDSVMAERKFCFSPHFTDHLKSALTEQWKCYDNNSQVRKKINEITHFLSTEEMFECSKMYYCNHL